VGWCDRARVANLHRVVNNSRFLLLPGLRVANLASHVLAQVTARRAAGWETAGQTAGVHAGTDAAPAVWMRPLEADWRPRLCHRPAGDPRGMTASPPARALDAPARDGGDPGDGDWQALEFGRLSHPDGRIQQRIRAMAAHWETRPGEPVAVAFPTRKEQKAASRRLANPRVTMDDILESHRAATLQRCRDETGVLAIQETLMRDCSPLQDATSGRARPGGGRAGSCGIPAPVTLAMSASGRMLGLLDIHADFRDGETGETDPPARTDPARTESPRWVDSLERV